MYSRWWCCNAGVHSFWSDSFRLWKHQRARYRWKRIHRRTQEDSRTKAACQCTLAPRKRIRRFAMTWWRRWRWRWWWRWRRRRFFSQILFLWPRSLVFVNDLCFISVSHSKELTGNADKSSAVKYNLVGLNQARFVRFVPLNYSGGKALRVEVYGVLQGESLFQATQLDCVKVRFQVVALISWIEANLWDCDVVILLRTVSRCPRGVILFCLKLVNTLCSLIYFCCDVVSRMRSFLIAIQA